MFQLPLVAIVDDDESMRLALTALVRSLGYRAESFPSAEALLAGTFGHASCIITDIQMPGMSGIELKAALDAAGVSVPVIMITARTEPELHACAMRSNPRCLLRKPFEADALIRCLEGAIEGRG